MPLESIAFIHCPSCNQKIMIKAKEDIKELDLNVLISPWGARQLGPEEEVPAKLYIELQKPIECAKCKLVFNLEKIVIQEP